MNVHLCLVVVLAGAAVSRALVNLGGPGCYIDCISIAGHGFSGKLAVVDCSNATGNLDGIGVSNRTHHRIDNAIIDIALSGSHDAGDVPVHLCAVPDFQLL